MKRIGLGLYNHKGYRIELVECGGYRAWNVFDDSGSIVDAAETLESAKYLVDKLKRIPAR